MKLMEKYPCERLCWRTGARLTRLEGLTTRSGLHSLHSSLSAEYRVNTSLVESERLEQTGNRPIFEGQNLLVNRFLSPVMVTVSSQGETRGREIWG